MKPTFILKLSYILLFILLAPCGWGQKVFKTSNVVDHWQNAVKSNDIWRYFPGTKEPDSNWIQLNYVDTSWFSGKGGIGYGDNDDSTNITSGISSLYIRKTFYINDTSKIWDILLNADYDDGFVAYINGIEITRKNIGISGIRPKYSDLASGPHEAQMYQNLPPDYIYIPKSKFKQILQNGRNVLSIQIHNDQKNSSDLTGLFWLQWGINDSTSQTPAPPAWFAPTLVTHLPIIVIDTKGQGIPNEPKLTCKMGIIENGTDQNHLTDSFNHYNGWIGIETRGSSSSSFPQQPYGFSLYQDSLGNTQNKKLLGFTKEHDFILYAPYTDKSLMRNNLVYQLSREMGWYASRTRFVELVLNGAYQGIYVLMETIKADQNRIDMPTMTPAQRSGDTITGGYIMKVDRIKQSGLGYWQSSVSNFNGQGKDYWIQTVDPDIPDLNQPQFNYIKTWMDNFESNLLSNNFSNTSTGFKRTTDVNSFIDFYLANELTRNVDAYRLSNFFYKQRESLGGRLYMGPVWDFNIALGNANYCNGFDTVGWNDCGYNNIPFWYEKMLQDVDYKRQLVCRWQSYRKNVLKLQHIYDYIDSVAEYLEIPQRRHYQQWQILGQYVWPNYFIGNTYKDEVNFLKRWVRGRINWMDRNMPKVPAVCSSPAATGIFISEVMYNCTANRNGGNWIELYNSYGISYNVGNFVIRDESGFRSFTIPPNTVIPSGGYLVIVEDTAAFRKIYPNVKNRIGPMNWGLANDHGTITLRDASNYLVARVDYSDSLPWPQLADGKGHSMELIKIGSAYALPSSWRNGCIDGTPGSGPACLQPVLISEINYASAKNYNAGDWVEIYNKDTNAIDLSGWVLKDDNDSNIYILPANTKINPRERIILANDKNAFRNIYKNKIRILGDFKFGLGASSDAIRLFDSSINLMSDVWYTDSLPHPYGARGTGFTIELSDSATNSAIPGEWRLSCFLGTPGKSRKYQCNISDAPRLTCTEVFLFPDQRDNPGKWLEFKSRDSLMIDLSGITIMANGIPLYTFPKGQIWNPFDYLLLSGDSLSFYKKYQKTARSSPALQQLGWPLQLQWINATGDTLYQTSYSHTLDGCSATGRSIDLSDTLTSRKIHMGCIGGSPADAGHPCDEYNYISEIHYGDGGWIEMRGIDTLSDISGFTLRWEPGANTYTFPAGSTLSLNQRKLLVYDTSLFKQKHPFTQEFQKLSGAIDTIGQLKLYNRADALIYNYCYTNKGLSWGYSLERNGIAGSSNDSSFWKNGCPGGSAGLPENLPCAPARGLKLQFTELMLLPDSVSQQPPWAEIYHYETDTTSLSGWGLLNQSGEVLTAFKNSELLLPQQLYIITPDSAAFLKYYPGFSGRIITTKSWSGTDSLFFNDYHGNTATSCGHLKNDYAHRFANQTGRSLLLPDQTAGCIKGNPGSLNPSCSNALIVSELMYQSSPGGKWIEIQNTSQDTIHLKNYSYITSGGPRNQFPDDTLVPGQIMVISEDTARFRQWYQSGKPPIYGKLVLNDSFGTIIIYNSENNPEQAMIYEVFNPWPYQNNYSIEATADTGNFCEPVCWQQRCRYGLPGFSRNGNCTPTGINPNPRETTIFFFPNPADEMIYIEEVDPQQSLVLMDALGKTVKQFQPGQRELNVNDLNSGIYWLKAANQCTRVVIMHP